MSQPSGWYDDPQDPSRLRYWDGILWSDHTVPKQSPTASASTIGRPVDPYAAAPGAPGAPAGTAAGGPPAYPGYPGYPGQAPYAGGGQTPYGAPPAGYGYGAAPTLGWRPSGPTTPDGMPLAEWWQRLLAALLDGLIRWVLSTALAFPWLRDFFTWYMGYLDKAVSAPAGQQLDFSAVMNEMTEQMVRYIIPITLVAVAVNIVYDVVFLTRWGATPGKMALRIRVRRVGRPGPLRLLEALRRVALPVGLSALGVVPVVGNLASIAQLLDVLWLLWDPRRQCLHDKVADTLVEQKPRPIR